MRPNTGQIVRGWSRPFCIGVFLLSLIATIYILTAVVLLCGGAVSGWIYPSAILLSALIVCGVDRDKHALLDIASALGIVALVSVICAFMEDASWDGNVYHQKVVALLLYGWNPYHPTKIWDIYYDPWVWHYAKSLEMSAASVASATGYIESGKSVNFILILSSAFLVYDFLCRSGVRLSVKCRLWLTVIAVANPVGMAQSITYYNDFAKYYYLLITIISAVSICRSDRNRRTVWYGILFAVIILAIGTKFTAFFEEGVAVAVFMLWLMWHKDWRLLRTIFVIAVVALVSGALLLGYHPYVTNCLMAGHPLYPLLGDGTIDIMTGLTPEIFREHGRVYNFFSSLLTLRVPYYAEFAGGFGALMPLLLAIVAAVAVFMWRKVPMAIYYIGGFVLASCFFYEQSWWARYICQLWLLVPIAVFATCYSRSRWSKYARSGIMVCVVLTMAGVGFRAAKGSATLSVRRQMLYEFTRDDGARVANLTLECRRHFEERGISVQEVGVDSLSETSLIFFGDKSPWVYPMVDVTQGQYTEFAKRCRIFGMHPERHLSKDFHFVDLQ